MDNILNFLLSYGNMFYVHLCTYIVTVTNLCEWAFTRDNIDANKKINILPAGQDDKILIIS